MAHMIWMNGGARAAMMLSAAMLLGGCLNTTSQWSGAEAEKRNTVEMVRLTHDVAVPAGAVGLDADAAAKLDAFMQGVNFGYGDRLIVDAGANASGGRAVTAYLQAKGLDVSPTPTPLGAATSDGMVRIGVERYVVTLPPCPDWRQPSWPNYTNAPSSNFGCANATALGLMVANPRDLVEGEDFAGPDGGLSATAITRYQEDKVKWVDKKSGQKSGSSTGSASK
jgi:pilus assembly protein CpaD